jgi:hypothetical protein
MYVVYWKVPEIETLPANHLYVYQPLGIANFIFYEPICQVPLSYVHMLAFYVHCFNIVLVLICD